MDKYKNVLVIDDDQLTTELIKEILVSDGYHCEICNKIKNLAVILEKRYFDIFIVDLMLDGMEGINLIKNLRTQYPGSIIIVITGLSASDYWQPVILAGADHYYKKPVNAEELLKRLKTLIERIKVADIYLPFDKILLKAFKETNNPVFITDCEGSLYFANTKFLGLTGICEQRIIRYNLQFLHLDNFKEIIRLLGRCDAERGETKIIETRFNLGSIDERWFSIIITPVSYKGDISIVLYIFQLYDITRKKQMDNFIINNEEKFRSFISLSNDGMALVNEKGQVIEWNSSLTRITGISMERVYGEMIWDILSWGKVKISNKVLEASFIKKYISAALQNGLEKENAKQNTCQIMHVDGHTVHLQYSLFTIKVDKGYRLGMVIRDNTATVNDRRKIAKQNQQLNAAYQEMEKLARIDPLTDISNRRDIEIRLDYELTRYERHHNPFSLAIADIDNFKRFNDTYGHDMGDFVLQEIADLMKKTIRAQDLLGRWGGEEFILIFPETELSGGRIIAERIRENIEKHEFTYKGITVSVTITVGLAQYQTGSRLKETIIRADRALYKGKESGKNCVFIDNQG